MRRCCHSRDNEPVGRRSRGWKHCLIPRKKREFKGSLKEQEASNMLPLN